MQMLRFVDVMYHGCRELDVVRTRSNTYSSCLCDAHDSLNKMFHPSRVDLLRSEAILPLYTCHGLCSTASGSDNQSRVLDTGKASSRYSGVGDRRS